MRLHQMNYYSMANRSDAATNTVMKNPCPVTANVWSMMWAVAAATAAATTMSANNCCQRKVTEKLQRI